MKYQRNESGELVQVDEAKTPLEVLKKKAQKYKSFRVIHDNDELKVSDMRNRFNIKITLAKWLGFDMEFVKKSVRVEDKKDMQFFIDLADFYEDWELYNYEVNK